MQITKRDGRIEEFQTAKVIKALSKAFRSCDKNLPEDLEQAVVEHVTKKAQKFERDGKEFRTEDVDNIIEKVLQQGKQHSAFKVYAKKRRDRNRKRTEAARNVFKDIIDIKNTEVTRENANMNADTPAGMMMKFASESTKSFVDEELLDDDVRAFVKDNKLHIHDKDYYPTRSFTCLDGNTSIMLKNEHGDVIFTKMKFFDKFFNGEITHDPVMGKLDEYIYIMGRNGWTRIMNVSRRLMTDNDHFYFLKTKKGLGLRVTGSHRIPVLVKESDIEKIRKADDINIGDSLLRSSHIIPRREEYIDIVKLLDGLKDIDKSDIVVTNIKRLQKWLDYKYDVTYLSAEIGSDTYRNGVTYLSLEQYKVLDEKFNIPEEVKNTLSIKIKRGKDRLPFYLPVSPELATIIGYMHSEGSVTYQPEVGNYQMTFVNFDERMIQRFNDAFSKVFSNRMIPRYTVHQSGKVPSGTCIASKLLVYLFKYAFGKRGGASEINIPSFLKNADDNVKWHYLSSLIDGDGTVSKWDENRLVRYSTVCESFAKDIIELLKSVDVDAQYRKVETKGTSTHFDTNNKDIIRNHDTFVINVTGKENVLKIKNNLVGIKQMEDSSDYAARPLVSVHNQPDEIIDKIEISKEGVCVYDIETVEHWFTANGYIVHNCVQHPLDHILNEGFQAGHGSSRPAKRIETASVLACISMETAQNEMHGGQAIPAFDFYLAPFVRMSFIEEVKKLEAYDGGNYEHLYNVKISDYIKKDLKGLSGDEKIVQAAINNTVGRVHQAMEAFIHNMNTIHSRGGNQVVFSSINFGTDTSAEGRCVIREILLSTYEGVGNGETAIFPIQIWKSKSGVSYLPGDPNYDLYELACKVTARRFFPNFLNLDATYNQDADWKADDPKRYEHEVATMGCRTRVFENRFGPKTSIGRGNISFSTINIVRLAIECMGIEDENERIKAFFEKLDEALDITAKQLDDRFNFQKQALAKQFPLLMTKLWIGCEDLKATDRVESVINQGTLGIGFIGLAECLVALRGKHHGEDEKSQELGLRIVTHMRDRVNGFCEQYKHNYSVLATPAEGLSGKFTKVDQKEFGKIPGVTDRDYYTNSNHVPVYYKCSAKHKAEVEAPYHELTRGGHIFYVEIDGDATHNPDVVKGVVDMMHAYNMGYGSINHNRNRCMDCGYEDASEGLKVCPKCGSKNIDVLQRITGSKNPIE